MMESGFSSSPPEAHPSPTAAQSVGDDNSARTPTLAGRQMSASLRERLKRSGRSYSSPTSTKRIQLCSTQNVPPEATQATHNLPNPDTCTTTPDTYTITPEPDLGTTPVDIHKPDLKQIPSTPPCHGGTAEKVKETENLSPSTTEGHASPLCKKVVSGAGLTEDVHALRVTRLNLRDSIARKEERLRKLKMVKMYRAKNDLTELSTLIAKWRDTSQGALHELLDLTQADPKPTLTLLIQHLGIDPKLLHLNPEDENFT